MANAIRSANLVKDTTYFLKSFLKTNITDPITANRPSTSNFISTSYPSADKKVVFPMITIVDRNSSDIKLGMQSEQRQVVVRCEIRVWGSTVKERDEISDEIYNDIRDNEITASTGFKDNGLHDLRLVSRVNIDEPNIKSKVMEYDFLYYTTWGGWNDKIYQKIIIKN